MQVVFIANKEAKKNYYLKGEKIIRKKKTWTLICVRIDYSFSFTYAKKVYEENIFIFILLKIREFRKSPSFKSDPCQYNHHTCSI